MSGAVSAAFAATATAASPRWPVVTRAPGTVPGTVSVPGTSRTAQLGAAQSAAGSASRVQSTVSSPEPDSAGVCGRAGSARSARASTRATAAPDGSARSSVTLPSLSAGVIRTRRAVAPAAYSARPLQANGMCA
jgi:hypothetical protein